MKDGLPLAPPTVDIAGFAVLPNRRHVPRDRPPASNLPGVVGGSAAHVVAAIPLPDAPHKGLALERERSHVACDTVIYVGNDEPDEDVFQIDRPGQLLSIRVGRRRHVRDRR